MSTKRQPLYTAALILSLVGNILAILFYASAWMFYDSFKEVMIHITNRLAMNNVTPFYLFLFFICYVFSLTGVLLLYRNKKSGFFVYLLSQLTILLLPIIQLGCDASSSSNAIFMILFCSIYSYYIFFFPKKRVYKRVEEKWD